MLKGVPSVISPELLKILAQMGHGDELVICDANCPALQFNKNCLWCSVDSAPGLMDAVLQLLPLDTYEKPVYMMEKVPGDEHIPADNWDEYHAVLAKHTDETPVHMERFAFYEKMRTAAAAVITADVRPYGNIIIKKGVFSD